VADALSGRFLVPTDDEEALVNRAQEIQDPDLLVLRPRFQHKSAPASICLVAWIASRSGQRGNCCRVKRLPPP
jgi:hypothetical protein